MKDTIKNSIVGGLAIFGLVSLISSSITPTPANMISTGIPESHVWEMEVSEADNGRAYLYNKTTGEVRKYDVGSSFLGSEYVVTKENVPKKKKK